MLFSSLMASCFVLMALILTCVPYFLYTITAPVYLQFLTVTGQAHYVSTMQQWSYKIWMQFCQG